MDNSIGDILNGETTDEVTADVVTKEVPEQPEVQAETEQETAERLRDEKGRFAAKETGVEPQGETVPPTTDRLPQAEYAALKDERTKRQQLEARLQEYENYFQQLNRQPQAPAEVPDMFADPDAFQAYVIEQAVSRARQELQPTIQQGHTMTRAEVSELLARQKYEDYDATIEVFKEAVATNPFLLTQIQQAPDPATFAYNAGKQYQQAQAYGGAVPSKDDLKAQLREEIIAELNLNRPTAPSTFAGDRSVGSRAGPAWTGPKPLGELLS
jgi:hypothetical protein